jgi:murein DD-endopeptidase MepM/ murein hydrolase activator NlpD
MRAIASSLVLASIMGASACGSSDARPPAAPWDETSSGGADDGGETTGAAAPSTGAVVPDPSSTTGQPDADSDTGFAPDVPAVDDCPRLRVISPDEVLNVRPDPSTANAAVATLTHGTIVDRLADVDGEPVDGNPLWREIQSGDVHGFVSDVFVECTLDEPPDLQPPDGFYIPLECGVTATITQGNNGVLSHNGLHAYAFDFGIGLNTPLVAMADGIVTLIYDATVPGDPCYDGGGPECGPSGNLVILLHGDGSTSLYKHLNEALVEVGDFVPRGEPIGLSGSTGYSTGRHAHVMRMENCGATTCQSIPLEFVEVGVPVTGDSVTSENCP